MAFNVPTQRKDMFGSLKRMTVGQRVNAFKETSSSGAASPFSLLTPAEFAELFPKYYQRGLPDVGGFREAISKKSSQRQSDIMEGLAEKAGISVDRAERIGRTKRFGRGEPDVMDVPEKITKSTGGKTVASGDLAKNQRDAYKAARAEGLSDSAARILVANLSGENLANPSKVYADPSNRNRNQHAHGIAAWDDQRAAKIAKEFGKPPQDMSVAEQIHALVWEMKKDYKPSWEALNNEKMSPEERMGVVVHDFERPRDESSAVSQRMRSFNGLPDNFETVSLEKVEGKSGVGNTYGSGQCVALSRHFAPTLPPASKWSFHEGESGIVPGAVIATRTYGQGPTPGGRMAKDMPDGKSHYHTGIALTYPDESGNVLVLDQWKGHGSTISKRNIRDYHGEQWGAVVGGEPSENTKQGVDLALSLANESQKKAIQAAAAGQKVHLQDVPEAQPVIEATSSTTNKSESHDDESIQVDTKVEVQKQTEVPKPQSTDQTATVEKPAPAATPVSEKPAEPKSFTLNRQGLINSIKQTAEYKKQTAGIPDFMVPDESVVSGFFDDARTKKIMKETGTTYDPATGKITSKNPDKLLKSFGDMDTTNVLTPEKRAEVEAAKTTQTASIGEKIQREFGVASAQAKELDMTSPDVQRRIQEDRAQKMQTPEPIKAPEATKTPAPEPKKPEVAPAPQTPAPQAGKPDESSTKNFLKSQGIPGASDGGSFNVGDRNIGFYPMDKKDNLAAVDTVTQQPLFTAKTGENINVDPTQNRIDITPQQKVAGTIPPGTQMNEMKDVVDTVFNMASTMGKSSAIQPPVIDRSEALQNQVTIDPFLNQKTTGFSTPSLERAMSKARGRESDYSANRVGAGTSIA